MIAEKTIVELVEEKLIGSPNFLVKANVRPGNKIQVFLDSDNKISVADCVEMSKYIESKLNRDEEDFELEVSSAGMDEPLQLLRQYKKRIGREVEVLTTEGKKIKGKLLDATENGIAVEEFVKEKIVWKQPKQYITNNINLTFNQIKETKLVVSFK